MSLIQVEGNYLTGHKKRGTLGGRGRREGDQATGSGKRGSFRSRTLARSGGALLQLVSKRKKEVQN